MNDFQLPPALSPQVFAQRRQKLAQQMPAGSVAVLAGAVEQPRNSDVTYPFRQHSDLLYLTGFNEPEAWLVLTAEGESHVFCRPRDRALEIWHGRRLGPEGVVRELGIDAAYPLADMPEQMPKLLAGRSTVLCHLGQDEAVDQQLLAWVGQLRKGARQGVAPPSTFEDLSLLLHEMRLHKSADELAMMRAAATLSAQAHQAAWAACVRAERRATHEYHLAAEIRQVCSWAGATEFAYPAIVGSGENGCILHYNENNAPLRAGDLVLIDAGCEWQGYASDITRTFPVNGVFSSEQRALYEVVLVAQEAAIAAVKPGVSVREPHHVATRELCKGLLELGLLQGELEEVISQQLYRPFFMHGTSHWLGLDVHDVGRYQLDGNWRALAPGMCLTIEPGLYIAADNEAVEARWRGIGIRIEDDVVVTEQGCDVLSAAALKSVADIEQWMAEHRG